VFCCCHFGAGVLVDQPGFPPFFMEKERRVFNATELRVTSGPTPRLVGHAAVFDQLSEDLGGFREKIAPGAFRETIKDGDIRALFNHDPNFPLARTKSGTLKLTEDQTGLAIDADLADTTYARDLLKSIERGDVDQMSFGFAVLPEGQNWRMIDGGLVRTLVKVELYDVSPVTFPAYPQTDVGIRSLAAQIKKDLAIDKKADFVSRSEDRKAIIERAQDYLSKRRISYVVRY
jgi:Escherichia/Staphylococcus phage prohead protease